MANFFKMRLFFQNLNSLYCNFLISWVFLNREKNIYIYDCFATRVKVYLNGKLAIAIHGK